MQVAPSYKWAALALLGAAGAAAAAYLAYTAYYKNRSQSLAKSNDSIDDLIQVIRSI